MLRNLLIIITGFSLLAIIKLLFERRNKDRKLYLAEAGNYNDGQLIKRMQDENFQARSKILELEGQLKDSREYAAAVEKGLRDKAESDGVESNVYNSSYSSLLSFFQRLDLSPCSVTRYGNVLYLDGLISIDTLPLIEGVSLTLGDLRLAKAVSKHFDYRFREFLAMMMQHPVKSNVSIDLFTHLGSVDRAGIPVFIPDPYRSQYDLFKHRGQSLAINNYRTLWNRLIAGIDKGSLVEITDEELRELHADRDLILSENPSRCSYTLSDLGVRLPLPGSIGTGKDAERMVSLSKSHQLFSTLVKARMDSSSSSHHTSLILLSNSPSSSHFDDREIEGNRNYSFLSNIKYELPVRGDNAVVVHPSLVGVCKSLPSDDTIFNLLKIDQRWFAASLAYCAVIRFLASISGSLMIQRNAELIINYVLTDDDSSELACSTLLYKEGPSVRNVDVKNSDPNLGVRTLTTSNDVLSAYNFMVRIPKKALVHFLKQLVIGSGAFNSQSSYRSFLDAGLGASGVSPELIFFVNSFSTLTAGINGSYRTSISRLFDAEEHLYAKNPSTANKYSYVSGELRSELLPLSLLLDGSGVPDDSTHMIIDTFRYRYELLDSDRTRGLSHFKVAYSLSNALFNWLPVYKRNLNGVGFQVVPSESIRQWLKSLGKKTFLKDDIYILLEYLKSSVREG